jgi:hypothetical protein
MAKSSTKKKEKTTRLIDPQENKVKFVPDQKFQPWPKPSKRIDKAPKGGRR